MERAGTEPETWNHGTRVGARWSRGRRGTSESRVTRERWTLPRFFNGEDCCHHLDGCDRLEAIGRPAAATPRGGAYHHLDRLRRFPGDSDLLCRRLAADHPAEAVGPVLADHLADHRPDSDFPYVLQDSAQQADGQSDALESLGGNDRVFRSNQAH